MRKLIFLFFLLIVLPACSHVGQFTKPVAQLALDWDETAEMAQALSEKLAVERRELAQLMDRLPAAGLSSAFTGENYLEEVDQLRARLVGHKSAFDELAGEIDGFLSRWDEKMERVDQLEAGLSAGELPRDVMQQVQDLHEFRQQGAEKIAAWSKEMDVTMEQWSKTEAAYRRIIQ